MERVSGNSVRREGNLASATQVLHVRNTRLRGQVTTSGAKNSVLRLLAASLLTKDPVLLTNCPAALLDVQIQIGMLQALGKEVAVSEDGRIAIEEVGLKADLEWPGRSIRNTLLVLGALTARTGRGSVPLPGGCRIGERKYDLHVQLLEAMGARVFERAGRLETESDGRLRGAEIRPEIRSTGLTENTLLTGSLAAGTTTLWNPHLTPEVRQLIELLRAMGSNITVHGQERIVVEGVESLAGASTRVIPDRMEAITWLIASVCTDGDVEIFDFPTDSLAVPLAHLRECGVRWHVGPDSVVVRGGICSPIEVMTGSHPSVHSDMQPLLAVYGTLARGRSEIVDLRYPERFAYAEQLQRMGADLRAESGRLVIRGNGRLSGAEVVASDLRAGAALLVAGLAAEGSTTISDAWQIERGYERIVEKLRGLGADVDVEVQ